MNRKISIDSQPSMSECVTSKHTDSPLRKLNQIREEHSYCLTSSPKKETESESKIESSNSSAQIFLTPIPKSSSVSITIQKQPGKVQFLTQTGYWPVAGTFSCGNFSLDLDYDSDSDECTGEDESNTEVPLVGNSVVVNEGNEPKHMLPNRKRIREDQAHDKPEKLSNSPLNQAESIQVQLKEYSEDTKDSNSVHQSPRQCYKPQQLKFNGMSRKKLVWV